MSGKIQHLQTQAATPSYRRVHFSLRHRFIASLSRVMQNQTYTVRHGLIKGMKRQGGLGFLPSLLARSTESTPEARFLAGLALGDVVYDIGALEGVLTLFFALRARRVVAYEPNPASRRKLETNLRLNHLTNVVVRDVAVGNREGLLSLIYDELMPGGATGDASVSDQIGSTSTATRSFQAAVVRLDDDIARHGLPVPGFIKIHIEGMELAALQGMQRTLLRRPPLYLEMHGTTMDEKERNVLRIVEFLWEAGYRRLLHIESGTEVHPGRCSAAREGHLYCSAPPGSASLDRTGGHE